MLCSLNKLKMYDVVANDGQIGKIKDYYFDEKNWVVRYLLIDSCGYLNRSNGFISTSSVSNIDMRANKIHVNFSISKIGLNTKTKKETNPREKKIDIQFSDFFERPSYWGFLDSPWVVGPQGVIYENIPGKNEIRLPSGQPNLPSYNQITRYQVHAIDAFLGQIVDILVNEDTWQFQFLELEKENWTDWQSTLLPYDLIERLNPGARNIEVLTNRNLVLTSPTYNPKSLPNFYFESILQHYQDYTQLRPEEIKRLELRS